MRFTAIVFIYIEDIFISWFTEGSCFMYVLDIETNDVYMYIPAYDAESVIPIP
jgi:hypothetical protein